MPGAGLFKLTVPDGPAPLLIEQEHTANDSGDRWAILLGPTRVIDGLMWCPEIEGFSPKTRLPSWTSFETSWTVCHHVRKAIEDGAVGRAVVPSVDHGHQA